MCAQLRRYGKSHLQKLVEATERPNQQFGSSTVGLQRRRRAFWRLKTNHRYALTYNLMEGELSKSHKTILSNDTLSQEAG
jgi:hypothetical protein